MDEAYAESSSRRARGAAKRSSNNKNDKYSLRKSKRKATVDYNELDGSDDEYEYGGRNTVSSRGRPIKMKGAVRA